MNIKSFRKMYDTGAVDLKERPQMPKCCILGLFFVQFIFHSFSLPSPHSSPTPPLPFHPISPLPEKVNKKLSYRRQNARSIIKTQEINTVSQHYTVFYAYASLDA